MDAFWVCTGAEYCCYSAFSNLVEQSANLGCFCACKLPREQSRDLLVTFLNIASLECRYLGCTPLRLYRQILHLGEVVAVESPEQRELLMSGLAVKREGSLRVSNRVYELVFDECWVEKMLVSLQKM